jgi:hypothetical protein
LETRVIAKAWQDEEFKQELLKNPTETIMKELGLEYSPDRPRFEVLEETPDILFSFLFFFRSKCDHRKNKNMLEGLR